MVIVKRRGRFVVDGYFDGKRTRKSFRTRKDADSYLATLKEEQDGLRPIRGKVKTLKEAINIYVATETKRKNVKTRGNERLYFEKLYTYLADEHQVEFVHQVRPEHLKLFQSQLSDEVSAATVNRHFHTYKHFFGQCEDWGASPSNPCMKVKCLAEKKNKRKPWTSDEIQMAMEALPPWAAEMFFCIAAMGLRPGEASNARIQDVDWDQRRLRVVSVKGTGEEREDFLPIPDSVFQILMAKRPGRLPSAYVFTNPSGDQVVTNYFSRVVRETVRKLGLEGLVPYGLRHGYITHLKNLGVDMHTIQSLARHASIKTTENYFHGDDGLLRDAVTRFEESGFFTGHKPVTRKGGEIG